MNKKEKITQEALEELKAWKYAIKDMKADGKVILPSKRGEVMTKKKGE